MHPAINLNIQKQNNPMRTVKFVIEISNRPISFIDQQVPKDGAYLMDKTDFLVLVEEREMVLFTKMEMAGRLWEAHLV